MAIKSNEPIKLSKEALQAVVSSIDLITELYEGIDELNGLLTTLTEELPKCLDESSDADVEVINDFYMALPVWDAMNMFKDALESVKSRAGEVE